MGRQPGDQRSQPALAPPGAVVATPIPQIASTHRENPINERLVTRAEPDE